MSPVIIIGAARSGTNMLRDMLCGLPGFHTWPCDEINYIWRYGNACLPTDELSPRLASERVRQFIKRQFADLAIRKPESRVVEKTCANSLRVEFVNRVIPDARFIFISRDGRDVVASARQRWKAPLDLRYVLKKARFVPKRELFFYALHYVRNRSYRVFSGKKRLAMWGPRFSGMDELLANKSLEEVCAMQWYRCVSMASQQLQALGSDRVVRVSYERFVAQPMIELERILDFVGAKTTTQQRWQSTRTVSATSVGRWKKLLNPDTLERIAPIVDQPIHKTDRASVQHSTRVAA